MTSNRASKNTTAPKGRPTRGQHAVEVPAARTVSNRAANLQWAAVIIAVVVIAALVIVFGSDTGGDVNHVPVGGHG